MDKKFILRHFMENWKVFFHLLLRTKRFGVNNRWQSDFDSSFGWPTPKIVRSMIRVYPIYENYQLMRFRAAGCHFIPEETAKALGWHRYWKKEKTTADLHLEKIMKLLRPL